MGIKYLNKKSEEATGKIIYKDKSTKQDTGLLTKLLRGAVTPIIQAETFNTPQVNIALDVVGKLGNPLTQKIDTLPSSVSNKIRADMLSQMTTPLDLALTFGGAKFGKFDSRLLQAEKAKVAIKNVRNTFGNAVKVGIKDVADETTNLAFDIKGSTKIINAVRNPIYEVEFVGGKVKQTVGNLNKVKEAVGELISSPKIWEEAPKKELRLAKQFYNAISKEMKTVAKTAGKPIDTVLDNYHNFMMKYPLIKNSITNAAGNAMGNKLRNAFKFGAEPAVKKAWKEVSRVSPELHQVMGSMNRRELLKNLLKIGVVTEVVRRGSRAGGAITSRLTQD
jgi:hypothetical protein